MTRRCSSAAPPSLRSSAQGVPSEVAGSSTTSFDGETSPSPSCPTCHCQALACRLSGTGWKPATLLRPVNLSIHGYAYLRATAVRDWRGTAQTPAYARDDHTMLEPMRLRIICDLTTITYTRCRYLRALGLCGDPAQRHGPVGTLMTSVAHGRHQTHRER